MSRAPRLGLPLISMLACAGLQLAAPGSASAAPAPQRTRYELPSANGHGAILLDLKQKRLTQFREHLFAAEEPVLDGEGKDVWDGEQFATVHTRDLLFDMYFGVRAEGQQQWLTSAALDEERSGYLGLAADQPGGTGIVAMVQNIGALRATTYAFAPQALAAGGFVLVLKLENTGDQPLTDIAAFSLHNFHLGYGRALRPWDVPKDLAANGETLVFDGKGEVGRFRERGFAGVVVTPCPGRHLAPRRRPRRRSVQAGRRRCAAGPARQPAADRRGRRQRQRLPVGLRRPRARHDLLGRCRGAPRP